MKIDVLECETFARLPTLLLSFIFDYIQFSMYSIVFLQKDPPHRNLYLICSFRCFTAIQFIILMERILICSYLNVSEYCIMCSYHWNMYSIELFSIYLLYEVFLRAVSLSILNFDAHEYIFLKQGFKIYLIDRK